MSTACGLLAAATQTSTGKSYSMMGIQGSEMVGLIPRVAQLLFHASTAVTDRRFNVETTYLEIYNEKLRDLLNANSTGLLAA